VRCGSSEEDAKRCCPGTAACEEIDRLAHIDFGIRGEHERIAGVETTANKLREASPTQTLTCLSHFGLFGARGRSRSLLCSWVVVRGLAKVLIRENSSGSRASD
jgi:hypothetical protein